MIDLIACAPDSQDADTVLESLQQNCADADDRLNVIAREEDPLSIAASIDRVGQLMILMIQISRHETKLREKLKLAFTAQEAQPDRLLLLLLSNLQYLEVFVNYNTQPNGVIMLPVESARCDMVLKRLVKQYLQARKPSVDTLSLKWNRGIRKIKLTDLIYLEAREKHLYYNLQNVCFCTDDSLKSVQQTLGGGFFQCHRSYIVNREAIVAADFQAMTVELSNGALIPLARSAKQELATLLQKRSGGAS